MLWVLSAPILRGITRKETRHFYFGISGNIRYVKPIENQDWYDPWGVYFKENHLTASFPQKGKDPWQHPQRIHSIENFFLFK